MTAQQHEAPTALSSREGTTLRAKGSVGSHLTGALLLLLLSLVATTAAPAHETTPTTHRFDRGVLDPAAPRLVLDIRSERTGRSLPARFSLVVDGRAYEPPAIGPDGLRLVSLHEGSGARRVVTYALGRGPVTVPLPPSARRVRADVVKGYEYLPRTVSGILREGSLRLRVDLPRWTDLRSEGWMAADAHLHFERPDPGEDERWLALLAGDDLAFAHFLVLRGGNDGAGVWAAQYAYGDEGRARAGGRWLVPGQEYRDPAQGHVTLLGIDEVIEPISTGGLGPGAPPENHPPLREVLEAGRGAGGLVGVAHGGRLASHPTSVAEAVLGAMDFWEISNGFFRATESWYRLLGCGLLLPPAAGTDLPLHPDSELWQPFLGRVRMYARVGAEPSLRAWNEAVAGGEVFVTSGPILSFAADDVGPGGTVPLPPDGGTVEVRATLRSPRPPANLQILKDGRRVETEIEKSTSGPVHRWRIRAEIPVRRSTWLAARGNGHTVGGRYARSFAHTGAVRVQVGEDPISCEAEAPAMIAQLERRAAWYAENGHFETPAQRRDMQAVFDAAIRRLEEQLP